MLDWSTVTPEHARKACELVLADTKHIGRRSTGLFVLKSGQRLPAKKVLRIAYALANNLSLESVPKFASGEGTLQNLRRLGLTVERVSAEKQISNSIADLPS
jgi:hypothetical protein